MAAQSSVISSGYAHALVYRGLLLLRAMGIGMVAGLVAGFVAGGVGSRLAMKAVAIVAGPGARGRITENGNAIGAFTADGTLFLLLFGATLGTIGGLLYVALRPWLAGAGRWRGLALGAILLATIRAGTIDARNIDFTHFGIPALNVALFAALPLTFGLIVAPLADWLDRRLPTPAPASVGSLGAADGLGLAALIAAPVALLAGLSVGVGSVPAPVVLSLLLLALVGYTALGMRLFPAGEARRFLRIGLYLPTIAAGLLGLAILALLLSGLVLNGDERSETRLGAAMLLLLFAGGLAGRLWLARDGERTGQRRMVALLAVPVLVGLGVTLREIGIIVLGL